MKDFTQLSLDDLWADVPPSSEVFDPTAMAHLPQPVQRYFAHAIAPGAPLASAVRLAMHGHIKLKGAWRPFRGQQVIRWDRGLIWQAKTRMGPLPISGWDRFIDGRGAMRWKLLGLVPVVRAQGPDISRSAVGRLQAEAIWLPSVLLHPDNRWRVGDGGRLHVQLAVMGHATELTLGVDGQGRLLHNALQRWGNPEGEAFHGVPFGGLVQAESTFEGYTIPTELRVGWYFGSDRFESEGEFWRATITSATYR